MNNYRISIGLLAGFMLGLSVGVWITVEIFDKRITDAQNKLDTYTFLCEGWCK